MYKHYIYNTERLVNLQGVLFKLIELCDNKDERKFYEKIIKKIENKIKEQKNDFLF